MALFPVDMVSGSNYASTTKKVSEHGLSSAPETARAIQYKGSTEFSTTQSYRQYRSELLGLFQINNFTPDQANMLEEVAALPMDQLVRVILLARALQNDKALFAQFATNIRAILARGDNLQEGLKSFLDGIEKILGLNTRKTVQEITAPKPNALPTNAPEPKDLPAGQTRAVPVSEFENHLYRDLAEQMNRAGLRGSSPQNHMDLIETTLKNLLARNIQIDKNITPDKQTQLKAFNNLAEASIEEFPKRYQFDLFSFAQLSQKGVSIETYIKLVSDVSPLRLLNVLAAAERQGQSVATLMGSLISIQESGGSVKDAISNLENKFGIKLPDPMTAAKLVPMTEKEITIKQGDNLALSFFAFDTKEGLVASHRTSFVVFPQKFEYAGSLLNLAFLPVGHYMIMAKAATEQNELMNLWIKVIVRDREKRAAEKTFDEFQKEIEWQKHKEHGEHQQKPPWEQQDSQTNQDSSAEQSPAPPPASDFVTMNFEQQPESFVGPFVGEVMLPLDFASRQASDLVVVSPQTGMVIDRGEFLDGCFSSHAIMFRFLANHIENPQTLKRHGLLHLKQSSLFSQFNDGLLAFSKSPAEELPRWTKIMDKFFSGLTSLFPAGAQTFGIAKDFFARESENFAKGENQGEIFSNTSLEKKDDRFVAAFYGKGAYAMASAGEVTGALHGMSHAILTDQGNDNHKAVLGEYLEELKTGYYTRESASRQPNQVYTLHIGHNFDQVLTANPYYKPVGERFIQSVHLALPPAAKGEEPKRVVLNTYGYGAYKK